MTWNLATFLNSAGPGIMLQWVLTSCCFFAVLEGRCDTSMIQAEHLKCFRKKSYNYIFWHFTLCLPTDFSPSVWYSRWISVRGYSRMWVHGMACKPHVAWQSYIVKPTASQMRIDEGNCGIPTLLPIESFCNTFSLWMVVCCSYVSRKYKDLWNLFSNPSLEEISIEL